MRARPVLTRGKVIQLPLFAAPLLAASLAHAQAVTLYGTYSPVHTSNVVNGTGPTTTSYWSSNFGVGATLGVVPVGPLRLGFDVRDSIRGGTTGSTLVLAGPKLSVHAPGIHVHPYIEAAGGYLGTHVLIVNPPVAGTALTAHYAAYEILGGVDYPIAPFFDFRLIEFGGGQGYTLSGSPGTGSNTVSLFTVNTGLVFHF